MRLGLEVLLKAILKNERSLENQVSSVGQFVKQQGGSPQLATGRLGVAVSSLMSIIWRIMTTLRCSSKEYFMPYWRIPERKRVEIQAMLVRQITDVNETKRKLEDYIRTWDSVNNSFMESAARRDIEAYKNRQVVADAANFAMMPVDNLRKQILERARQ